MNRVPSDLKHLPMSSSQSPNMFHCDSDSLRFFNKFDNGMPANNSTDNKSLLNYNSNYNSQYTFGGRHSMWQYFDVSRQHTGAYYCRASAECQCAYSWPPSTTVAGRHL